MIPRAHIQAWSTRAPWPDLRQVEQDLIISRALCDLFSAPALKGTIAFRGGTAIHKLLFERPLRYSEDIDLVQSRAGHHGLKSYPFEVTNEWHRAKVEIASFTPEEIFVYEEVSALILRARARAGALCGQRLVVEVR